MKNKEAKAILTLQYGKICFLGGTIHKKNPLTVHHLVPVRLGGQTVLANLALLCRLEHDMFNVIERYCPKKGDEINDYFRYFKESRDLEALKQIRQEIINLIDDLGYSINDNKKILTLKKRK